MTGNDYQKLASRTNDGFSTARLKNKINEEYWEHEDIGGVINGCLGLSGEVGEFNDMVKKWIFHKKPMDFDHLKKELGDVLWYVAMICKSLGWDLDDVMQTNIDKLKARYPEGFDPELSNHRKEGDV